MCFAFWDKNEFYHRYDAIFKIAFYYQKHLELFSFQGLAASRLTLHTQDHSAYIKSPVFGQNGPFC